MEDCIDACSSNNTKKKVEKNSYTKKLEFLIYCCTFTARFIVIKNWLYIMIVFNFHNFHDTFAEKSLNQSVQHVTKTYIFSVSMNTISSNIQMFHDGKKNININTRWWCTSVVIFFSLIQKKKSLWQSIVDCINQTFCWRFFFVCEKLLKGRASGLKMGALQSQWRRNRPPE